MAPELTAGHEFPHLHHVPSSVQLFRYSAATWNPHRIHYDEPYARSEGHRGLLMHSHLRAALALRCVTEHLEPDWELAQVSYRVRRPVTVGDKLTYGARVRENHPETGAVMLELSETHVDGAVGLEGSLTIHRGVQP